MTDTQPARTEFTGRLRVRVRSVLREPQNAFEHLRLFEARCTPSLWLTPTRPRIRDCDNRFQLAHVERCNRPVNATARHRKNTFELRASCA